MQADVKRDSVNAESPAGRKPGSSDVDPRVVPQMLSEPPPIGDEIEQPVYGAADQQTWKILFERQMALLPGRAGEDFLNGVELLGLVPHSIPSLRSLSTRLSDATGWQVARVPGLLDEKDFFTLLSRRIFPSTDYIRGRDEIDYTPAPDCFHDIFGHMPMLTQPHFADFYQMFGRAALDARGEDRPRLERLHWFTVEFGLVAEDDGRRIFGAGILSSHEEVTNALSDRVKVHPFDPLAIVEHEYDVWHLQEELFELESFEQLVAGFSAWARRRGLLPRYVA